MLHKEIDKRIDQRCDIILYYRNMEYIYIYTILFF